MDCFSLRIGLLYICIAGLPPPQHLFSLSILYLQLGFAFRMPRKKCSAAISPEIKGESASRTYEVVKLRRSSRTSPRVRTFSRAVLYKGSFPILFIALPHSLHPIFYLILILIRFILDVRWGRKTIRS